MLVPWLVSAPSAFCDADAPQKATGTLPMAVDCLMEFLPVLVQTKQPDCTTTPNRSRPRPLAGPSPATPVSVDSSSVVWSRSYALAIRPALAAGLLAAWTATRCILWSRGQSCLVRRRPNRRTAQLQFQLPPPLYSKLGAILRGAM